VTHGLDDDTDALLVRLLAADGRATLATLAAEAGLSVSAVQARVRRLESRGVITGYAARSTTRRSLPLAGPATTPLDPAQPDDAPQRLTELGAIEAVLGRREDTIAARARPAGLEGVPQEIRRARTSPRARRSCCRRSSNAARGQRTVAGYFPAIRQAQELCL
jgi:Lrp/AsnC family leucine-responsive transcriptional regulator